MLELEIDVSIDVMDLFKTAFTPLSAIEYALANSDIQSEIINQLIDQNISADVCDKVWNMGNKELLSHISINSDYDLDDIVNWKGYTGSCIDFAISISLDIDNI